MRQPMVVGIQPWLPKVLREWDWFSAPVPAERLAALRIGTAFVLLIDVAFTYWPFRYDYFGPGSLAEPAVFTEYFQSPRWGWSLIYWFPSLFSPDVICGVWLVAALMLLFGVFPRIAALVGWAMSVSVFYYNGYLHNSGDLIRQHLLFFLMLTPCGAAWALTRPGSLRRNDRAAVYPWAIRLLFLELVVIYFFNGVYKVSFGDRWRSGEVMHYVLHTPGWCRWSPPFDLPLWLTSGITYSVLAWELSFPFLVLVKQTRIVALSIGASFHLLTFFNLEIGPFGLYALCMYLPLLPWERLNERTSNHTMSAPITETLSQDERSCVPA